ncbi:MAG TPA: methionine--tRNA ligase, partial [Terriglobia bacterium]|nr:methionine--tRNA ligase [Terriglobia bacterium]
MKKFYLTTPLYYPNARPHVGNSYTTMVCDAIARYKRMCGYDVAYLTGTDEHGEKLQRAAAEAGMSPPEFVASKRQIFYTLWKQLHISYSHFIYTDRADHVRSVQRMLLRARANGYINKRRYEGRYCVSDERYISDGTEPADCDICGRPAELISEENYFFKLSAFQDRLLEHYDKHPEFVLPDFRRNEVVSFVKSGLRDISVSRRRIKWGIPWPDDPEQVFYVWYDALTGYMTGIGYAEGENGSPEFQKYWPADCHMVGKDIIRFHAVYWPAFLMAADLPLPRTIFAHGWLTIGADKMSKSKGNVVYCEPIVAALGADPLRYYLMRDIPFGQDSSFTYDGLIRRYNSDLANDLGNLASRAITMVKRYFDGRVPTTSDPLGVGSRFPFLAIANGAKARYQRHFEGYELSKALEDLWHLIRTVNQYLNDLQPWAIADDPSKKELLANVLCTAYEALRFVAVLAQPFIPESSQKLWEQLGQKGRVEDFRIDDLDWANVSAGIPVGKPEAIFPRLDKEPTLRKLAELAEADRARAETKPKEAKTTVEAPAEQKISIEDFAKVEMRTGEIRSAEPVPGAQK